MTRREGDGPRSALDDRGADVVEHRGVAARRQVLNAQPRLHREVVHERAVVERADVAPVRPAGGHRVMGCEDDPPVRALGERALQRGVEVFGRAARGIGAAQQPLGVDEEDAHRRPEIHGSRPRACVRREEGGALRADQLAEPALLDPDRLEGPVVLGALGPVVVAGEKDGVGGGRRLRRLHLRLQVREVLVSEGLARSDVVDVVSEEGHDHGQLRAPGLDLGQLAVQMAQDGRTTGRVLSGVSHQEEGGIEAFSDGRVRGADGKGLVPYLTRAPGGEERSQDDEGRAGRGRSGAHRRRGQRGAQ